MAGGVNLPAMSRSKKKYKPGEVAPFPRERFLRFIKALKIQSKDYGITPFKLLGSQLYILDGICAGLAEGITTFVILKSRQLGSSTFFLAIDLFWAFEHPGLSGSFATHTDQSRDQFRQIMTVFLAHLPSTHKQRVHQNNRSMMIFKNGSQFTYLVAGTKDKKSSGLGRSGAYNFAHCTEVAFWGSEDDIKAFRAAQSSLYAHRLQIFETTANGFNTFHQMWEQAEESKTIKAIFVGWWRDERNRFDMDHAFYPVFMPKGPETSLTNLERKRVHAVMEEYGVRVTHEQIAWYRWKMEDEFAGDQIMMDQEFPWTETDAFVATGSKFFTGESLTDAMRDARKLPVQPFAYSLGRKWDQTGVMEVGIKRAQLKVWQEVSPHGHYAIGCDPAYGSSDTADRTVIEVFRCYGDRCEQVAEFVSPVVSTYQCAWVLAHIAGYYRNVMVNLEITGPGTAVFNELTSLRNDMSQGRFNDTNPAIRDTLSAMRHFLFIRPDSLRGEPAYQWKTTHENKLYMLNAFKDSFELGRCRIKSMHLLDEMKTTVMDEGTIQAEGTAHDDRVMAAGLAHEAWRKWLAPRLLGMGVTAKSSQDQEDGKVLNPVMLSALNYIKGISSGRQ
jgi:hypothetical protein